MYGLFCRWKNNKCLFDSNSFTSWCFFFQINYSATELRVNRWYQTLIHTSHITYVFLCNGAFCRFGLHIPFGSLLCLVQSRTAIHLMIWQHENNNKNTQTRWGNCCTVEQNKNVSTERRKVELLKRLVRFCCVLQSKALLITSQSG